MKSMYAQRIDDVTFRTLNNLIRAFFEKNLVSVGQYAVEFQNNINFGFKFTITLDEKCLFEMSIYEIGILDYVSCRYTELEFKDFMKKYSKDIPNFWEHLKMFNKNFELSDDIFVDRVITIGDIKQEKSVQAVIYATEKTNLGRGLIIKVLPIGGFSRGCIRSIDQFSNSDFPKDCNSMTLYSVDKGIHWDHLRG